MHKPPQLISSGNASMDPNPLNPARSATVRFNIADGIALAMVAAYILVRVLRFADVQIPAGGLWLILFVLGLAYLLLFRGFSWARAHLPWRLRNRLIVAYLLIAVVPLLLVLVMALLSLYLLYWHFGAYLLYADIQQRLDQVSETAETVATSYAIEAASTGSPVASLEGQTPPHTALFLAAERENLPGLKIDVGSGADLLQRTPGRRHTEFKGLVLRGGALELCAVMARRLAGQELIVTVSVPVSPEFLDTLEPQMGPVQIDVMGDAGPLGSRDDVFRVAGKMMVRTAQIQAPDRPVPPATHWFDYTVTGYTRLQAVNAASAADPKTDVYRAGQVYNSCVAIKLLAARPCRRMGGIRFHGLAGVGRRVSDDTDGSAGDGYRPHPQHHQYRGRVVQRHAACSLGGSDRIAWKSSNAISWAISANPSIP